jgi:hypothetical protein
MSLVLALNLPAPFIALASPPALAPGESSPLVIRVTPNPDPGALSLTVETSPRLVQPAGSPPFGFDHAHVRVTVYAPGDEAGEGKPVASFLTQYKLKQVLGIGHRIRFDRVLPPDPRGYLVRVVVAPYRIVRVVEYRDLFTRYEYNGAAEGPALATWSGRLHVH